MGIPSCEPLVLSPDWWVTQYAHAAKPCFLFPYSYSQLLCPWVVHISSEGSYPAKLDVLLVNYIPPNLLDGTGPRGVEVGDLLIAQDSSFDGYGWRRSVPERQIIYGSLLEFGI